ncbi:hypothetical protein LSH36_257g01004 [Paralvinella palmiformis]|uniref:protein-serine/threonine phosphatase n=1 Tax=Paralvinella palmiformis TaxID=53620 RepID=A0AAD9N2X9_9ANNE|nr:hypothetical protein LSH36_257g01004 [Paralvinella palmiformis]
MASFSEISQITESLYLSGASAITANRLRSSGITHVINCTLEVPDVYLDDIDVVRVPMEDSPNSKLYTYFDKAADRIQQVAAVGGKTLVHCVAGVSRSTSICLAYLMKYRGMTLIDAYRFVKKARPVIRPNVGFFKQLIEYEKKLYNQNTVTMVNSPVGMVPSVYKEETSQLIW